MYTKMMRFISSKSSKNKVNTTSTLGDASVWKEKDTWLVLNQQVFHTATKGCILQG